MLLKFATRYDLNEHIGFVNSLLQDANGRFCKRQIRKLMCVSHSLRQSSMVIYICRHAMSVIECENALVDTGYMCTIAMSLHTYKQIKPCSNLLIGYLYNFADKLPPLNCYGSSTLSHTIIRHAIAIEVIDSNILTVISNFFCSLSSASGPIVELSNTENECIIKISLYCLYRCVCIIYGDNGIIESQLGVIYEETTQSIISKLIHGIIVNYSILTKCINSEVFVVKILQNLCSKSTFSIVFETLLTKFYIGLENLDSQACTLYQEVLVRIITDRKLQVTARIFIDEHDIVDVLLYKFAAFLNSPVVGIGSLGIHMPFVSLITECISVCMQINAHTFQLLDKMLYSMIFNTNNIHTILHRNYIYLILTGLYAINEKVDTSCITRIIDIVIHSAPNTQSEKILSPGVMCITHIIIKNKSKIHKKDWIRIYLFALELLIITHVHETIYSDLLFILAQSCKYIDSQTFLITITDITNVMSVLQNTNLTLVEIQNVLHIIRQYILKTTSENFTLVSTTIRQSDFYNVINNFIRETILRVNGKRSSNLIFKIIETTCLLADSQLLNNVDSLITCIVELYEYMLSTRRVSINMIVRINGLLTCNISKRKSGFQLLSQQQCFTRIVHRLCTCNRIVCTQTHSSTLSLLWQFILINNTTCMCNYNINICRDMILFSIRACTSTMDLSVLYLVQNIICTIIKCTHHTKMQTYTLLSDVTCATMASTLQDTFLKIDMAHVDNKMYYLQGNLIANNLKIISDNLSNL